MAVFVAAADALPWPASAFDNGAVAAANVLFNSPVLPSMSRTSSNAVVLVWATGAVILLARWLWEWFRMTAIARAAEPISDGPVVDALRRLEPTVGIFTPTKIVCSQHNLEPGIIGIRKPVLVWPRRLAAGLQDDHIQPIVAHELAHVVRRDNLLASFHMLVCAVFWFFPVVWWIGSRLIEERERACDEQVLALGQSPVAYAAGIIKTCELCIVSPLANVSGITGGDLKKRVTRIMRSQAGTPLGLLQKMAVVLVALVVLAVPIAIGSPQGSEQKSNSAQNDSGQPERPGPNVTMPRLTKEVRPQYSSRAIAEKIEGEVVMDCVVKADGTVGDIKIVKSLDPDLDQAAIDAAQQWEFEPGTRDGKPVAVLVTIAMAFTLKK
jgi:TonB family protein